MLERGDDGVRGRRGSAPLQNFIQPVGICPGIVASAHMKRAVFIASAKTGNVPDFIVLKVLAQLLAQGGLRSRAQAGRTVADQNLFATVALLQAVIKRGGPQHHRVAQQIGISILVQGVRMTRTFRDAFEKIVLQPLAGRQVSDVRGHKSSFQRFYRLHPETKIRE